MLRPLISVITVVYDARKTLEATIQSVLSQNSDLFEYWIIDGGSTDGSVDLIHKYEHKLAGWFSEADAGIYDAMNKGIDKANGEWIYFLGGDDILRPDVLKDVQPYLDSKYSAVFGDVFFDNGHHFRSFLGKRTLLQNTIHHQSAFYNNSLFTSFRYDTKLSIVSDYEMNLQLYIHNMPIRYIPIIIANCATGGASSFLSRSLVETNKVRSKYIKPKWKNKFLSLLLSIYYAQKRIRLFLYGHRV
ncbi:glycosyltransferase family 2 protein [Spirosoma sp. KNUC1025]|uniref:glycosyltransferase family 2 protein n=1 Tax=Spirosoma sp. KNUC1025 TaxID=2894082 RepID=UPI0038700E95|nr:glycosyltransferase [Spirosoma sp. KNUC1025]